MDLVQIGKFIAEMRKQHNLTQEQFGEKLCVTNKTVSRWETGTYLPPADALLSMSNIFQISINEILSGRRLSNEEYKAAAEENLTRTMEASKFTYKDRLAFFKKKWLKTHIAVMIVIGVCILAVLITGIVLHEYLLIAASTLLLLVAHGWRNNTMMAYAETNAYTQEEKTYRELQRH